MHVVKIKNDNTNERDHLNRASNSRTKLESRLPPYGQLDTPSQLTQRAVGVKRRNAMPTKLASKSILYFLITASTLDVSTLEL